MDPARRRSRAVAAPLVALLAVAVSGCGASTQSRGVCRDTRTDRRVDDEQCRRGGVGVGWWYFASGQRYPAVGAPIGGVGAATPRSGSEVVRGGAPAGGGSVAKGGFGGRGGGVGG